MVILLTDYYQDPNPERNAELHRALLANLMLPEIDKIIVFTEPKYIPELVDDKFEVITLGARPTYNDFFAQMQHYVECLPDGVSTDAKFIIANLDIEFDSSLRVLHRIKPGKIVLGLSRDDIDGHALKTDCTWSQDAWVCFEGFIPNVDADFNIGKRGCDNRISNILQMAGYQMFDLRSSINLIHHHKSAVRNQRMDSDVDLIKGAHSPVKLASLLDLDLNPIVKKPNKRIVLHIALLYTELDHMLCKHIQSLASSPEDYYMIDWVKEQAKSKHRLDTLILKTISKIQPDLTFMQIQGDGILKPDIAAQIPGIVINWTGDVRQPLPDWFMKVGKNISLTLFTNQADAKVMLDAGLDADYLQTGFHPEIFNPRWGSKLLDIPDIVFMGNNYAQQFPLCQFRRDMVNFLQSKFGQGFAVYGNNWGTPHKSLNKDHRREAAVYRSCKIAIGCSHFDLSRYSSDRLFRAMGSGAFYLTKWYPDIEKDFIPGVHLDVWHTLSELEEKIRFYLAHPELRNKIAAAGCKLVHNRDTWAHRMATLRKFIS
jgi:hypothetical protein